MNKNNESIGIIVGVLMGLAVSLVLSIVGPVISGHFKIVSVLVSFLCSSIISVVIGLFIPIRRMSVWSCSKIGISPDKLPGMIISALIGDICFTPLISFLMVYMNYKRAKSMDPSVVLGRMYCGNLIVSFVVAFLIILIFTPLFIRLAIGIVKPEGEQIEESEEKE